MEVQYFDLASGVSQFKVFVNDQQVDEWHAAMALPGGAPSADSSVRRRVKGLILRPGDVIRIEGIPDGGDRAVLDYIDVTQATP
jgi:hypothetical protein